MVFVKLEISKRIFFRIFCFSCYLLNGLLYHSQSSKSRKTKKKKKKQDKEKSTLTQKLIRIVDCNFVTLKGCKFVVVGGS